MQPCCRRTLTPWPNGLIVDDKFNADKCVHLTITRKTHPLISTYVTVYCTIFTSLGLQLIGCVQTCQHLPTTPPVWAHCSKLVVYPPGSGKLYSNEILNTFFKYKHWTVQLRYNSFMNRNFTMKLKSVIWWMLSK